MHTELPPDFYPATERANVLAQALPFLRRYAGATVVVKYGGHAMGDEDNERVRMSTVTRDFVPRLPGLANTEARTASDGAFAALLR